MGILRLRRIAFTHMPPVVAAAIAVAGIGVCAFAGFVLIHGAPANTSGPQPLVTLAPDFSGPAPAQIGNVQVIVRTVNGPVADAPVTLSSRFAADEPPKKLTGRTDASGSVSFDKIDINPGSPWVAIAHYDGRDFPSSVLRSGRTVTIYVANVAFDPKHITVDAESLAIVGDADGMEAVQALTVVNHSVRAFAGGVSFPLIEGATAIDPRTGLDRDALALDANNQMVSTAPVLPGSHEFTYTYIAPMGRTGTHVRLDVFYATKRFDVLIGGKVALEPQGKLRGNGTIKLAGRTYHRFTAQHLHAGEHLTARIVIPKPSRVPTTALLVLAIGAALAIIVLPLLRRRRRTPEPPTEPATPVMQPEWT
jgi:hypothetical protein